MKLLWRREKLNAGQHSEAFSDKFPSFKDLQNGDQKYTHETMRGNLDTAVK